MSFDLDYRIIFNASTNGMSITHGDSGVILDVNDAWVRASGIARDDAVGRTGSELAVWADAADREACVETLQRDGRLDDYEAVLVFRGEPLPHLISVHRMEMAGERHLLWELRDISKRKRDEEKLCDSERRFREIFNAVSEAIFIHDAQTGAPVEVNDRMVEMYGFTREEILAGKQFEDPGTPPYSVHDALERLRRAREEGPQVFEWLARRKDGSDFWAEVRLRMARIGARDCILAVVSDITERKQLEAKLRESQKMEALGTLAGGIAHDFNNVLATILGNAALACEDTEMGHPARISLDEITKAGQRARALVQQILAFGRQQDARRTPTSLALVVLDSARFIRATLPAMVSLRVTCQPDAPPVLADAGQIEQILINLCANALHAVEESERAGVIEIELARHDQPQRRGNLQPGQYACLTVRDNGRGMDEATATRVFEPFYTTKTVGRGSGLGLAVVHGILQNHEAIVEMESTLGAGTTFRMFFAAADVPLPLAARPRVDVTALDGGGTRVLYVDDEEAIIYLMTRLLERRGCLVSGYTDPKDAVAAIRTDPARFDLVVTDYRMPVLTGLDVAKAVKDVRPDMTVVLASGYITDDLRRKAPAAGVAEIIHKPNTVEELCESLARFIEVKRRPRAEVSGEP